MRLRHFAALLSSPLFALDMKAGRSHLTGMAATAMEERSAALSLLETADGAHAGAWPQWLVGYFKESGLFPYYVNTDGGLVHSMDEDAGKRLRPGAVLVVPEQGVLVKQCDELEEWIWGLCSSQRIARQVSELGTDPRVAGVVLRTYSPGGMVYGTEAKGAAIAATASVKPVYCSVDSMAASAAYWGACNCTKVLLDGKTSEVGSIGVMTSWLDLIPYFETMGAKWREHYAPESKHKNEGWRALREKENAELLEKSMSTTAVLFHDTVRKGRGAQLNLKDPAVLAGRMYEGDAAIEAGLADGYATLEQCIAMVRTTAGVAPAPPTGKTASATATTKTTAENPDTPTTTMSIKSKVVAVLAAVGLAKEAVSEEVITEINAELEAQEITNLAVVSTAEQQRLTDAGKQVAEATAAKALAEAAKTKAESDKATAETARATAETSLATANTALETERSARTATDTAVKASVEKHGLQVAEGSTELDTVLAALEASTTALKNANAEIAQLKGEDAPDERPAGAVNKTGDVNEHSASDEASALKELDSFIKD